MLLIDKLKKSKLLADFFTPEAYRQLMRYLVIGFSTAAIEFTLLFVFKDIVGLTVLWANSAALSIVFWFNFLLNRFWSFKSKVDIRKQLIMYAILFLINLGASDLMMYLLVTQLRIMYLFAKVFAMGAIVCWNFFLYRKVIYK
jgi:putative flippase GtrA